MKRVIALIVVALSIIACEGKQGPAGPAGDSNRIVYESTNAIPSDNMYVVSVPEINLNDMPLVAVYLSLPADGLWFEIPLYVQGATDFGAVCFYQQGKVIFLDCGGFRYKIVIVK